MYPLCMNFGSSDQGIKKTGFRVSTGYYWQERPLYSAYGGAHRIEYAAAISTTVRAAVGTTMAQNCVKPEPIGGRRGDLLCFLIKTDTALSPYDKGSQGNACNQTFWGLDTLEIHLESWSWEQFLYASRNTLVVIPSKLTANFYVSLVIQLIVLPFMNDIRERVFQKDNPRPRTNIVT
ncbi:uncharacterized protein TNCV_3679211 [Trichonephila clavipes]|nr:uncharacterized protein TNCV_3679211 [Trichonephila clavipes]